MYGDRTYITNHIILAVAPIEGDRPNVPVLLFNNEATDANVSKIFLLLREFNSILIIDHRRRT